VLDYFSPAPLVKVEPLPIVGGGSGIFWKLTQNGCSLMMSIRTIKTNQENQI
jgi:hypothetical protein